MIRPLSKAVRKAFIEGRTVLIETAQRIILYSCACIATDEGGIPDIIDEGRTGFLVPKNDPQALATALGKLVADRALCASMGCEGRKKFLEKFTLDVFERNFTATLESLLEQS